MGGSSNTTTATTESKEATKDDEPETAKEAKQEEKQFDPEATIAENFPIITAPTLEDYPVHECKIDLKDKSQAISFEKIKKEFDFWSKFEVHQMRWLILEFLKEMIKESKVTLTDDATDPVTLETAEIAEFLKS